MIMAEGIESAALEDVGNEEGMLDGSSGAYALAPRPAASALAFASRVGAYSGAGAAAPPTLACDPMSRSLSLPLQAVTASIAIAIDPIAVSLMDISCAGVVWRRRMSLSRARLRRSLAGPFRPLP
jgi:hypothetical protein